MRGFPLQFYDLPIKTHNLQETVRIFLLSLVIWVSLKTTWITKVVIKRDSKRKRNQRKNTISKYIY